MTKHNLNELYKPNLNKIKLRSFVSKQTLVSRETQQVA